MNGQAALRTRPTDGPRKHARPRVILLQPVWKRDMLRSPLKNIP